MTQPLDSDEQAFAAVLRQFFTASYGSTTLRESLNEPVPPTSLWQGLADLGLFASCVAEPYDGVGQTVRELPLVVEELGRALAPGAVTDTLIAADLIDRFGSPADKTALLPSIAQGALKISLAVYDSAHQYDPATTSVRAECVSGIWYLSGTKFLVADVPWVDLLLVSATETTSSTPALFMCSPSDPTVTVIQHQTIDSSGRHYKVTLDRTPVSQVLGHPDTPAAPEAVAWLHETGAWCAAGRLIGAASRTLDMAVEYAKIRQQFGRPIGAFQAIKHICAEMYLDLEMSRAAFHHARLGQVEPGVASDLAASIAKAYAGEACRRVLYGSLQVHGGIGFTWEHDFHFYLKRGKYLEQAFGSSVWHRERVAQRLLSNARKVS